MHEYSNIGRTLVRYACSLAYTEFILKFLRRNPSALFADFVIFSTCCFQFRLFVIVTPRYLAYVTVARTWSCRV